MEWTEADMRTVGPEEKADGSASGPGKGRPAAHGSVRPPSSVHLSPMATLASLALLLLAVLALAALPACGDASMDLDGIYLVTFVDGSGDATPQLVSGGGLAAVPDGVSSSMDGCGSPVWTLDGAAYDFGSPVLGNLTLVLACTSAPQGDGGTGDAGLVEPDSGMTGETDAGDAHDDAGTSDAGLPADAGGTADAGGGQDAGGIETCEYRYVDWDGKVLKQGTLPCGSRLSPPAAPSRDGYDFTGWSPDLSTLEADAVIQATYARHVNQYTYTFLDWDGTVLKRVTDDEGATIVAPPDPSRDGYDFTGWDKAFSVLSADVTITATYRKKATLSGKRLSIMGDSISTFYSATSAWASNYGGTDEFYYPVYSSTVKSAEATWWGLTLSTTGMVLESNESKSGMGMVNWGEFEVHATNLRKTADPDAVILFLGTNDNVNGHTIDRYRTAYEKTVKAVKSKYPSARLFCMTMGYSGYTGYNYTEDRRTSMNAALKSLASTYGMTVIDIAAVQTSSNYKTLLGDSLHPNADGMKAYSNAVVSALKQGFGVQ